MLKRQLPVGVIQICSIVPGPSIAATSNVCPGSITTDGETFHPRPKSRDGFSPVPVTAMPPSPLAPVKFSGLMERDSAWSS